MTTNDSNTENWQQPSLAGLHTLTIKAMPAFEILLIDELAAYVMGSGPLAGPYTVEHGSRVLSALFGAVINSDAYSPDQVPEASPEMERARVAFVDGAHAFAALSGPGLAQLANRLIPAVLGELEIHKDSPEEQTRSLFYYSILAVASGPLNLLAEDAANGVSELFQAWDAVLGAGLVLPWRHSVDA